MASIDLTGLPIDGAVPIAQTFGGIQRPATGGAVTRIERLGSRWAFSFTTPPMRIEPDYRRWSVLFDEAERLGAIMEVYLPEFKPGPVGSPLVAANTPAGREIPISGLTPNYEVRVGQWVSVVSGGKRYLDRIIRRVTADADGAATVTIKNLIRAPLTTGNVVELAVPKIEGSLEYSSASSWSVDGLSSFAFTITEDA